MSDYKPECGQPEERPEELDAPIRCWCGVVGTPQELFDPEVYTSGPCGGLGVLHCECGGDFCVCHNHGEVECPGCEDCEPEGHDDYDLDDADEIDDQMRRDDPGLEGVRLADLEEGWTPGVCVQCGGSTGTPRQALCDECRDHAGGGEGG